MRVMGGSRQRNSRRCDEWQGNQKGLTVRERVGGKKKNQVEGTAGQRQWLLDLVVDAPPMRQHARKCAQQRLRARSPTQGSGGPTGRWRGNARATATATHTQLNSHPSCIDRAPSPSYPIALKLSKSIEHLWYDASPANQGAAAP